MRFFFERMIENLKQFFEKVYKQDFTNQTIDSCMGIYNLCIEENPDCVIEIGTNHGASTFALAKAVKDLNKKLSIITTVDIDHEKWKKTFKIQQQLIEEFELYVSEIKIITNDFIRIDPKMLIDENNKVFIFYDMHDHKGPWSQKLLDVWVPLVKKGVFCIHDISPVDPSFKVLKDKESPRTKIKYMDGQYYAGFNECFRIIKWANTHTKQIKTFPGGIYFRNG